ncbi:MAG TPA: RyR domain-containing protein, partial [Caulobacteraceae bacterium]|nr:RyR domain-containing protein [Caulobacteraceae bacterium]
LFPLRLAWIIPVFVLITLGLGVWAWRDQPHRPPDPFDEALYKAIGLFDIDGNAYSHNEALRDVRFRIARWTGAFVVFSGLLALASLLNENLATALARWTKQAVVVIGDDPLALAAFETARRLGRSTLWLGASAFGSSGFRAIALAWPATDRTRAVFDHTGRADHILVADHDDAEALAFARAARAAAPTAFITVLMRDVRIAEDAAATLNEARTRVLSTAAIAARALNNRHPPFQIARDLHHSRVHALIVGFGQTGQAIARDLIVNCRTTYLDRPRITVIDPQAKALEGVLRVRAPEIDACADCYFIEGEIGGRAVRPEPAQIARDIAAAGPVTAAYVCLATDVDALSTAAVLQSLLRAVDIATPPIFVRLRDAETVAAGGAGRGFDALTPFGDMQSVLEASEFLSNEPDAAARAFCEAYRATLTDEQRLDPANRSGFPWDRLDETYRQANRDAVAHVAAKLASAGIDPVRWRGARGIPRLGDGERMFGCAAELEALAELEHERWNAQRRMDGWRWTDRPRKDEGRRLHPSLVPYENLADDVKEYDRVYVRQTQDACQGRI